MDALAWFAARPLLLMPSALPGLRAALGALSPPLAGPEPGPAPEPRDVVFGRAWPGYAIAEDGVATIRVHGPIVDADTPLDNLMATLLGGTIGAHTRAALDDARTNRAVRGVLLDVNTPGGQVTGTAETAAMIRGLDAVKPVVAHVGGFGASRGYWEASAAGWIVGGPTSLVGSIGTIYGTMDDTEAMAKAGIKVHSYVSTQSPLKVPVPGTPEGDAAYQEIADSITDVFLADVAAYRGTSPLRVMEDFGQGDVLIASEALKVGMIDRVGSRADALAELRRRIRGAGRPRAGTSRPAARTGRVVSVARARSGQLVARTGVSRPCLSS